MPNYPTRIVVVGGGFTGFFAARKLAKKLGKDKALVTLISDSDGLLYQPLLPQVAVGSLDPRTIAVPLTTTLPGVRLVRGRATGFDYDRRVVKVVSVAGYDVDVPYDRLLITPGSVSRMLNIPGLAEHGIGFKTVAEALYLRDLVLTRLEIANDETDAEKRRRLLNFVVVGAGYAGTELVAQMAWLTAGLVPRFDSVKPSELNWMLLDMAPTVMPELGADLARDAQQIIEGRGVDVRMKTSITSITEDGATLTDGDVVPGAVVVWTAGVTANPVAEATGFPTVKGRIVVEADLTVPGHSGIYAAGDAAAVPDITKPKLDDGSYPLCATTAQHAMRQGHAAARIILQDIRGQKRTPYKHRDLGLVVDMGGSKALARPLGVPLTGRLAKLVTRGYHVFALPSLRRKVRTLLDWVTSGRTPDDVSFGITPIPSALALDEHRPTDGHDS